MCVPFPPPASPDLSAMEVLFVIWVLGAAALFVSPVTAGGKTQRTEDILAINNRLIPKDSPESSFLLEGDIIRNRSMSTFSPRVLKWPKVNGSVIIPYLLSNLYEPSDIKIIMDAFGSLEDSTCLRFVNRTNEKDYISVEPAMGCFSSVGRMGGMQVLSLSYECLRTGKGKGVALHELMHVAGFWHEHSRADREDYIQVLWDQILQGYTQNFCKYETSNMLVDYDLMSILHYSKYAFSKSGLPTITPRNPHSDASIGQRYNLSYSDILRINKFYSCPQYNPLNDDNKRETIHFPKVVYPCSKDSFSDHLQTHNPAGESSFTLKSTITSETPTPKQSFMKETMHSLPSSKIPPYGSSETKVILASSSTVDLVQDSTKVPPLAKSISPLTIFPSELGTMEGSHLATSQAFSYAHGSIKTVEVNQKSDYRSLPTQGSSKKSSTGTRSTDTFSLASTSVNILGDGSTIGPGPQIAVSEPENSASDKMAALPEEQAAPEVARSSRADVFQDSMAMLTSHITPQPLLPTAMIQQTPTVGNWATRTMFLQTGNPSLPFGIGEQFIRTSTYQNITALWNARLPESFTRPSNMVPMNPASQEAGTIKMATKPHTYATGKHLVGAAGTEQAWNGRTLTPEEVTTFLVNGDLESGSLSSVSDTYSGHSEEALHDFEDKSVVHLNKKLIKIVGKRSLKVLENSLDKPQKFSKSSHTGVFDRKVSSKNNLKSLLFMKKYKPPISQYGASPQRHKLGHHLYRILKVSRKHSVSRINASHVLDMAEKPQSMRKGALSLLFPDQNEPPAVLSSPFYNMHSDKGTYPRKKEKALLHMPVCGFGHGLCGWKQSVDDNLDWSLIKGHWHHWISTGSPKNIDKPGGAYLSLTNSSKKQILGARACLLSPVLNNASCISFWYGSLNHMMGTLNVYIRTDFPGKWSLLWSVGGQKQMEWTKAFIKLLPSYRNKDLEVVVEGVTGPSAESDIVLDNVYTGQCT